MKIPKKVLSLGLSLMLVIGFTPNAEAISSVDKIQGKDRYETAAKIAEKQNYTTAILVNSDKSLADGLSASGLSGTVDAPILLTKKESIPNVTLDKLKGVTKVYIIGGVGSIDESLEAQLKEKGIDVVRIGGNNRIETSYNVAKEINNIQPVKKVVFTNAYKGEPDAMSVASVAARDNSPIVLTDGTSVDESSITFDIKAVESYAIGGVSAISDKLVRDTNSTRLGGIDRFDTNKKIINKFYPGAKNFYIAKSHNLVDALTGSAIAKDMPIVLVNDKSDKTILKNASKVVSLGGIDRKVINQSVHATNGIFINQNMEVHFINVSQGDATYIEMPNGDDILIDAGVANQGTAVVNYLKAQEKDIDIEYMIATHPDADHIGGMQDVFKQLNIKNFYYPQDAPHDTQTWQNVLNLAKVEGCKVLDSKPGTTLNGGATLKLVHPSKDYTDNNEDSVVALLDYDNTKVLLTGDAEAVTEQDMVSQNLVPDVDVLKVGHHGSNSSTTQAFLNKVKPEHAVISVGQNSYGHPTQTILSRLTAVKAKIWRTDKNGHIILNSDGSTYNMKAVKGGPTSTATNKPVDKPADKPVNKPTNKPVNKPVDKPIVDNSSEISNSSTVYVTPNGKSYHLRKNCRTLKRSKTILSMTLKQAKTKGKSDPCNVCVR